MRYRSHPSLKAAAALGAALIAAVALVGRAARTQGPTQDQKLEETADTVPLPTGRVISPIGNQTDVGSFPCNMAVSPDGKYLVVTNSGFREYLSVLSVQDGHLVSKVDANKEPKGARKAGLYYGLAFGPRIPAKTEAGAEAPPPGWSLFVSRGAEGKVSVFSLGDDGTLRSAGPDIVFPADHPDKATFNIAGVALSTDGKTLYAVNNETSAFTNLKGQLAAVEVPAGLAAEPGGQPLRKLDLPGFPFGIAATANALYVSSERDGVVSVVDPKAFKVVRSIPTGDHPAALLLDRRGQRLFVANAGSDTISVIDTAKNTVAQTIVLRPEDVRGLPGATPLGMALGPGERRLYVALADMNAVAVVDLPAGKLAGYVPTGWYPTSCAVSPEGYFLFVANAKGVKERNPNGTNVGSWGKYIQNIIEGTVAAIPMPRDADLPRHTQRVLGNNRLSPTMMRAIRMVPFLNPGIRNVIYIIKENRTYDQVYGDMTQGNGDPSLCMFPREVTPNQHALAERFALLDNFYDCAEVSGDGWDWSTSGMISEYTGRNVPYNYSGRGRKYDFEGDNNGVPVDLRGIPDVARAPSGYIWDAVAKAGLSYRNYGFYLSFVGPADRGPEGKPLAINNRPNKRALVGHTDDDFLQFDLTYADSDAWVKLNAPFPKQRKEYGSHHAPSRFSEWKREFDGFVKRGEMPRFMMMRVMRDHTAGTSVGLNTPRSMVADNDYAIGEIVDAVSHSPFWKSTAIFVLEDDAQNGNDHVDAHRSGCLVISPTIKRGTVDHRFYNTDSTLRTMELILGLHPMNQYDQIASWYGFLGTATDNDAPYDAILPPRSIIGEVNQKTAYKAGVSARLDFRHADAVPDDVLTDIVWHATMGARTPMPPIRHGLRAE